MGFAVWSAWAFCLFAVSLHCLSAFIAILRTARRPAEALAGSPAISLLRPVRGLDCAVAETLGSTFRLANRDHEITFCAASATDPVVPLVERLIAEHPEVNARLVIGDERISINPKLNNLVKGWEAARHDWVLMSDSNIVLPPAYVEELFACWRADTALVCSPPIGGRPRGFAAEVECAFLNTYHARWQITADALGVGFAQGKTLLWRRDVLEEAGGITALAAEPAEDAAATKIIRRAGLRVRLAPGPYIQPLGRRSLADVWRRQLRWARLRRVSFPMLYLPELLSGGLPPLAAAAFLVATGEWSLATFAGLAVLWYGLEALLAGLAGWWLSPRLPLAWMVRDLLLPVLWASAWIGNGFVWRGNAMEMPGRAHDGDLQPAGELRTVDEAG